MRRNPERLFRVLMVSGAYPPDQLGGAEMQCRKLSTALAARGHQVTVLTSCRLRRDAGACEESGVVVRRVWSRHPPQNMGRRMGSSVAWTIGAVRAARSLEFDIVHSHQAKFPSAVGAWIARRRGVPNLAKIGDSDHKFDLATLERKKLIGATLARYVARSVDRFVAISEPIREDLEAFGVPARRIERIPNGVVDRGGPLTGQERLAVREGLDMGATATVLVSVGRFSAEKNLVALIDAVGVLDDPRLELHMFGSGPMEEALRIRADEARTRSRIAFHGVVDDPTDAYRVADFLVLPSLAEGLSNTLLEAAVAGLPAIATAVGGTPEVVADGVTGYLAGDTTVGDLGTALRRALADNGDTRAQMSAAIRARALARYEMAGVVERYESLYAELART
ncbi:MAG: glycosyltransferase family 4 protein [Acidimicrobiales bacterium]